MAVSATSSTSLDVNAIVSQLMTLESRPLTVLAQQEAKLQSQISSWGSLKGALSSLQTAVRGLGEADGFRTIRASVADTGVAVASASADAAAGSYSLEVTALAQQHKLRSEAFAAPTDSVGTGTLTFRYGTYASGPNTFALNGDKAAQTVTIAAGQDSLAGIRDAVNAAGIGVSASLVNDGGGHRLVFTSKDTGAASSLKVTVSDGDGNATDAAGLSRLAYDPVLAAGSGKNLVQSAAAQDAALVIDGIAVTSASNTVGDAIEGVTLNLLKTNASSPTTVAATPDVAAVKKSVETFVTAYNNATTAFRNLTAYNPTTKSAGLLQGDSAASGVVGRLRGTLNAALAAFSGTFGSLSQVGVSFQKDGLLALDGAKFQAAIDRSPEDLAALFARTARPTHDRVAFADAGPDTRPGTYAVAVTQPATRGSLAGSAPAGLTITAGVDDTVEFAVDGVTASITLTAKTYASAADLAAELKSRVNGASALSAAGIRIDVAAAGGVLTLTSMRYGSDSTVAVTAGAGANQLFGGSATPTAGLDVAGTINGVAASGAGQRLEAASGTPAEGLALQVTATAAGSLGTVNYTIGYAAQLDALIDSMLETGGTIASRTDGLNARIGALNRREERLNTRLADTERRLRAQYVALDAMLSRMNSTSTYLTQQLASLPGASR